MKDSQFLEQLRATFRVEAGEHVQAMSAGLLKLETAPAPEVRNATFDNVFRAVHSLKGAARAVDYRDVESLCQMLEDIFDAWKRRDAAPPSDAFDTLYRALDAIRAALDSGGGSGGAPRPELSGLRQALRQLARNALPMTSVTTEATASIGPVATPLILSSTERVLHALPRTEDSGSVDTVRVAITKLNAGLLQAEELLTAKLAAGQRIADLRELLGGLEQWKKTWSELEPDAHALLQARHAEARNAAGSTSSPLDRLLDFFEHGMDTLKKLESRTAAHLRAAEQDRHVVGKLVDQQLEGAKSLLLLPFGTIATSFQKIVRDLCRDQGKEAILTIHGEDIEIDKLILEEIKDPLIHLLRNSVDHGIETPRERVRQGKLSRATIRLAVSQTGGSKVQLLLSDDGAGIDTARVKDAAVKRGLLSADAASQLDEASGQALIFRSEVSTSPLITEVSGRGLGLAIVCEKVEKLGGQVTVDSKPGKGSTFRIVLPAVRATFHGVLVEVAGRMFVVPTAEVERVGRVDPDDVKTVEGQETITVNGRTLALVQLADALELPSLERKVMPPPRLVTMILGSGDRRIAFTVDAILDEQEILVKPLSKPLSRVRNISGATVLGSGQVVPILHVADLLKSARKVHGGWMQDAMTVKPASTAPGSILVAEDSITSRMLLKAILEAAGYRVKTAVDGMEAFTLLRTEKFDLLVSDVEMPRMNGFDLTARVRAAPGLANLPVLLVTALETREDRERGIDAGANGYIVKRSFDQSNLLEAVRRLI
jgi:two-component system, chemotaxis family, sensor kinase CheA